MNEKHVIVAQMWWAGAPAKEIAEASGLGVSSVYRAAIRLGLPGRERQWTHGASGYQAQGCRCEVCTKGNRDLVMRSIRRRTATSKDPNDPRHGTRSFYVNHGCRCDPCSAAHSKACAEYDARRKAA